MVENVIKTFKLNFDGTFDEIAYENIKDVFTIVNILAIYITKIKTMYIWIGKNATQALKNHIPNIRVILKEEFPQFRIIRNQTFDMRSEPYDFFKNLEIKKDELYEIIDYQEKIVLPILKKVDELKEESEKLIKSEEYKEGIEKLKKIIELAQKIQDDALITEHKKMISEIKEKYENQQIISEIEGDAIIVEKRYSELIKTKDFIGAHNVVGDFIKKFEDIYDLNLIPKAKELISEEKNKWNAEQEKLRNSLSILEKDFNAAINTLDVPNLIDLFEKAETLLSQLLDEKIRSRWTNLNKKIQEVKEKVNFIERFEQFITKSKDLKENHFYPELKSRIKSLERELNVLDLPEYRSKLELVKSEVDDAERLFKNQISEVGKLEKLIKNYQKNDNLNEILKECEKIIELTTILKKPELSSKYQAILEQTKGEIKRRKEFEEKQKNLRQALEKLENDFKLQLQTMKMEKIVIIFKKAEINLFELIDDDIKNKWDEYKNKFHVAKKLIEDIEALSQNGIEALEKESCSESLNLFEQIINQLQEYKN
ncbi:MAG: hypothetical protein ACFFCV_14760 [Promethearchaeota archaeon]